MQGLNERFILELGRIKNPEIFLGVARILKVQLVKEEKARDFGDIFKDTIEAYENSGRKRKRELLKILREANNAEGGR